jgi:signal transduction histidine kinase
MDATLQRFHHVLRDLARRGALRDEDVEPGLRELLSTAADTLGVARVGVWLFEPGLIRQRLGFSSQGRAFTSGEVLFSSSAPSYFAAIEESGAVVADDAWTDPRTCELLDVYLRPTGTMALLDVPIWIRGRLAGVVCHEQVGGPRAWAAPEQTFAASIADLVALLLEGEERRRVEVALREREMALAVVLEATEMGAWSWHRGQKRPVWDDTLYRLFRMDPATAPPSQEEFLALIHPEDRERVEHTLATALAGPDASWQMEYRTADGKRWFEGRGRVRRGPDGVADAMFGVVLDVTERRTAAHREARDRRLEALGRLAAGVAHDFNNVLASIVASSELLANHVTSPQGKVWVQNITSSSLRASEMTRHLLALARGQPGGAGSVDLVAAIRAGLQSARPLLSSDIAMDEDLPGTERWVRWNAAQAEQVVVNLVLNARDAMPDGGRVRVSLVEEGPEVVLRVADTGPGMSAEVLDRIFEPFFTTKGLGRGTGLGLATSFGYVAAVGGTMLASSPPGEGATLEIRLPRAEPPEPPAVVPRTPVRPGLPRVLLVEDQEDVRVLITEVLRRAGHHVLPIRGVQEAHRAVTRPDTRPEVLIVDVALADGSGVELARHLAGVNPGIGVVFISGYAPEMVPNQVGRATRFLAKPFRNRALLDAVAEVAP